MDWLIIKRNQQLTVVFVRSLAKASSARKANKQDISGQTKRLATWTDVGS